MVLKTPRSLESEHEELHRELSRAILVGGPVGAAAARVASALHAHFGREEALAMPILGLLAPLARGEHPAEAEQAAALSDRLRVELPEMLAEHQEIVRALEALVQVAHAAHLPDVVLFAEKLKLHAQNEEEVLYPAALLVGEVVRARQVERSKE